MGKSEVTRSTIDPLASDAPMIVYMDIKSPYAFVAYRPTLALERELGMQFDWRPLTLDIPSYLGSAQKKDGEVVASTGRSERLWRAIRYSYMDARRYAQRQGLTLKGTEKIWDSSLANIGFYWVAQTHRECLGAYFDVVYPAFWRRELDIEDPALIDLSLRQAGVNSEGFSEFASGMGRQEHDELQVMFHQYGLYGVPSYVLDGDVFFGREHIPYLRWCLSGKNGAAPDIAYELFDEAARESHVC